MAGNLAFVRQFAHSYTFCHGLGLELGLRTYEIDAVLNKRQSSIQMKGLELLRKARNREYSIEIFEKKLYEAMCALDMEQEYQDFKRKQKN